jgi:hypothetical protein
MVKHAITLERKFSQAEADKLLYDFYEYDWHTDPKFAGSLVAMFLPIDLIEHIRQECTIKVDLVTDEGGTAFSMQASNPIVQTNACMLLAVCTIQFLLKAEM